MIMFETNNTNDGNPWWIVQTKPQAEFTAIEHLENQNFITYCPLFKKERIRKHQFRINTVPLFPRYIFVKTDQTAQQNVHVIRSTFGVSQLLKIGEIPTKISCQVINELRQMEAEKFGETHSHFKPGDHVQIKDGLYENIEAVYQMDDGFERAVVLLSIISKETPLRINKHDLQKV